MDDKRALHDSDGHVLQGPHLGAAFVPLRLLALPEQSVIEVARPALVVGRHSDADVRLGYPEVSRRHCRLAFEGGQWRLYDLDSLNGVYLNDERVHEATLCEGDRIRIGATTLVVTAAPAPAVPMDGAQAEKLKSIVEAVQRKAS
jgi:pSer/pThr/pTyr-binding forkhead associated (FHA) protein